MAQIPVAAIPFFIESWSDGGVGWHGGTLIVTPYLPPCLVDIPKKAESVPAAALDREFSLILTDRTPPPVVQAALLALWRGTHRELRPTAADVFIANPWAMYPDNGFAESLEGAAARWCARNDVEVAMPPLSAPP